MGEFVSRISPNMSEGLHTWRSITHINLLPVSGMENSELTYAVIGCAMKVHNVIGNGFQERIYQRCLAIELQNFGLLFQREVEVGRMSFSISSVYSRRAFPGAICSRFDWKISSISPSISSRYSSLSKNRSNLNGHSGGWIL